MNEIKKTANEVALRIQQQPGDDKAKAEVLELQAKALVSLVEAQKTIDEIEESRSEVAKKKKKLDYWLNKIGVSISVAGIVGSITLLIENFEKNGELAVKELAVQAAADKQKTAEDALTAKEQETNAKVETARLEEKHALENADLSARQAAEVAKELETRKKQLDEKQKELLVFQEDIEKRGKEQEDLRAGEEVRNKKLVALPKQVKATLYNELGQDHPVVVATQYQPAAMPPPVASADEARIKGRVADLFSPSASKRGSAYEALSNGKDRSNDALVPALIEAVEEKMAEYKAINLDTATELDREKAALIRRGLENAVVTLRDSSRKNTTRHPANKAKLSALATSLTGISYGVGEEARRFLSWLNDPINAIEP